MLLSLAHVQCVARTLNIVNMHDGAVSKQWRQRASSLGRESEPLWRRGRHHGGGRWRWWMLLPGGPAPLDWQRHAAQGGYATQQSNNTKEQEWRQTDGTLQIHMHSRCHTSSTHSRVPVESQSSPSRVHSRVHSRVPLFTVFWQFSSFRYRIKRGCIFSSETNRDCILHIKNGTRLWTRLWTRLGLDWDSTGTRLCIDQAWRL